MTTSNKIYSNSELLNADNVKHGFFSRNGGVSKGIYQSLNVGSGSGDNSELVNENRKIASHALGFDNKNLITPYQIHSAKCVYVGSVPSETIKADALITDTKDLLIGVVTADCLPILLCEPMTEIIGAIHAGWKGAVSGIIENTISMIEQFGGRAAAIRAVIGPAIQQNSYQVQQDFYDKVIAESKDYAAFFCADGEGSEGYRFDLPSFALARLHACGVRYVEVRSEDTYALPQYFSYRQACHQNNKDYGRQLSAIGLC